MALLHTPIPYPPPPVGDDLFGRPAKTNTLSCTRLILLNYRQSRDAYLLYGGTTYPVLVWIYKPWQGVSNFSQDLGALA